jgi:hypothetical protein
MSASAQFNRNNEAVPMHITDALANMLSNMVELQDEDELCCVSAGILWNVDDMDAGFRQLEQNANRRSRSFPHSR